MRIPASLALAIALTPGFVFAQKQPFTPQALLQIQRIGDPQISPDAKTVAFSVSLPDLTANKSAHSIWTVPLAGGTPRKLADMAERPRWTPDGKHLYYSGTEGGTPQIWRVDPDGANPTQVTHLSTGASGQAVSADGKYLVVTSDVYPACNADDTCNQRKLDEAKQSKTQAHLVTSLLYRHWNAWQGDTRTHILSISLSDGKAIDLSPGDRVTPPFSLGGPDDYAISPDSAEVAFAQNADPNPATGTNNEIFTEPIAGGTPTKVSNSPGADNSPAYSPDGKYLAWRSQARAGYESDKWRITALDRSPGARPVILTDLVDRQVNSFLWSPDSKSIFFTAVDRGLQAIQFIAAGGGGVRVAVSGNATFDDMQFTPDGKTLVFTQQSGSSPAEIRRAGSGGGTAVPLTHLNDALLSQYQFTELSDFMVSGLDGTQIQSFVVKPPNFDPTKKYPVIMLIHGGPQGEWGESWTYRWNAQVFAGAGYVVVMPNPRGSVGYGQKFTDDINQDWGGKPFTDIMAVTDYVAKLPYVDADRMTAAGGSYGGYMINWILGHTNRFKALISHDGVYDTRSEAESTEELWFPTWEFGGMPADNPEVYDKWSPSKFSKEFKTPTLVVHGELDYRIPSSQAYQLFTGLQLAKVPSELLDFPDEGHWVLKPQNSLLWYKTFLDWIGTYTK